MAPDAEHGGSARSSGFYSFDSLRLDLDQRRLFREDEPVSLSPKAFNLLEVLVRSVDQVVPSAMLLDEVWSGVHVEASVLKVRIAEIRAALDETASAPVYIHTHQRVGYRFAGSVRFQSAAAADESEARPVVTFSERPALAILPFDDFSASDDAYFADGLVEELTTRLARFRYFPVIARNSSFVYKGQAIDVTRASRELGARYVLEGSVQRSEDQARVIVQLIDGQSGHHIWTDRFESDLTDIFRLNDEITDRIAGAMHSQVFAAEMRHAEQLAPRSLDVWYCLLRAWSFQDSLEPSDNASAIAQFQRALEADAGCAQAHSGLAMSHFRDVLHGWSDDPLESVRATRAHADEGLRADPHDPYSHLASGVAHWLGGSRQDLLDAIEHAVWLNPSLAWAYLWGGIAYGVAGQPDRSMEMASHAIRLSPLDPLRGIFDYAVSIAHFSAARYEEAFDAAKKAVGQIPGWGWPQTMLACSAAMLGRDDEAQAARKLAQESLGGIGIDDLAGLLPFAGDDFIARAIDSAKRAGWPG
jgi:TolB-like protein